MPNILRCFGHYKVFLQVLFSVVLFDSADFVAHPDVQNVLQQSGYMPETYTVTVVQAYKADATQTFTVGTTGSQMLLTI